MQHVYIITSLQQGGIKKSCGMYISLLYYNNEGLRKVTVCIYHHFIITRKDEKSCNMYISTLYYHKEGWKKVAVCIYHHFIITRRDEENLQYVYIITSLWQGSMKKSCAMYISWLYYHKEGWRKVAVFIYHHFIITRKD